MYSLVFYFFFFKQKTAYEMRISDWSSDVCSSDLTPSRRTAARISPGSAETMSSAALPGSGPVAETGQEIAGLRQRQADHVGIGADDLGDEGGGGALDGIAASLAAPLAAGEVALQLLRREALHDARGGNQPQIGRAHV